MKKTMFIMLMAFVMTISSVSFLGGMDKVYAAGNPYDPNATIGSYWANCTYWAWQHAKDHTGVELPGWGNAGTWANSARASGFTVSNTPRAQAIVVYGGSGTFSVGHVAYVSDYNSGTGKIYIKEGGWNGSGNNRGRNEGWISAGYDQYRGTPIGFIYLTPSQPSIPEGKPIGGGAQLVSDGDYHIVSAIDPNKGIDVYGNDNTNGTNIHLYANTSDNNQVFTVKNLGDGFYSIRRKTSGKSLDVVGASRQYGTNLQLYDYNGSDAQKWVIKPSSDSKYFKILSKCNGLCIDVDNSGTANYTNIKMWEDNGERAQMWKFVACGSWDSQVIDNGRYEIVSALSPTRCVDVEGVSKDNEANIHLWTRLKNPNQIFDIQYLGNGYYEMIGVHSGKAVEIGGDSSNPSNANVNIYSRNGTDAQKWIIRSAGNGYFYIICKGSGLYLDVDDAKAADGTNIKGWIKNGSIAQKWKFERVKRENTLAVKGKTASVKYSKLKKKTQTLKISKVLKFTKKGQGKMSYKLISAKKGKKSFKKKFRINSKTGKVKVKKGLKKGTYKVKIKVKTAGNAKYRKSNKTVTFKIKVR